jgi:hypothetical protein
MSDDAISELMRATTDSDSLGNWYYKRLTRHYITLEQTWNGYISSLNNEELIHIIKALVGFALLNATMAVILPEIAQAMFFCFLFAMLLAPILYSQRDMIEKWEKAQSQIDDKQVAVADIPPFSVRHIIGYLVNEEICPRMGFHSLAAEQSIKNVLGLLAVCPTWAETINFALGTRRQSLLTRWSALRCYNSERKAEGKLLSMCRLDQFAKVMLPDADDATVKFVKECQEKTVQAMKASGEPWWITVESVTLFFNSEDFEKALEGIELDEDDLEPLTELERVADRLSRTGTYRQEKKESSVRKLNKAGDAAAWRRCASDMQESGMGEGIEMFKLHTNRGEGGGRNEADTGGEAANGAGRAAAEEQRDESVYELPVPVNECTLETYFSLAQQQRHFRAHGLSSQSTVLQDEDSDEFTVRTQINFAYKSLEGDGNLKLGCKVIIANNTGQWLEISGWFNDFDYDVSQRFALRD